MVPIGLVDGSLLFVLAWWASSLLLTAIGWLALRGALAGWHDAGWALARPLALLALASAIWVAGHLAPVFTPVALWALVGAAAVAAIAIARQRGALAQHEGPHGLVDRLDPIRDVRGQEAAVHEGRVAHDDHRVVRGEHPRVRPAGREGRRARAHRLRHFRGHTRRRGRHRAELLEAAGRDVPEVALHVHLQG